MKKLLLTLTAVTLVAAALQAQTRLSLYEEFSGENCGPCAAYNPGLWTLLSTNTSNILLIKYQSPIPSAGPIYNAYKTVTNARLSYYGVPFAPYGVQNGNEVTGNISAYSQSDINASVASATPFALNVTHQWTAAGDSVYANISISTPNVDTTFTGANLKLRVALIEHLDYCTAPGTNGETEFHNVVREMYPDASGTSISNTWTKGQTQNIRIGGLVPGRVNKSNDRAVIVVWIQNDPAGNKGYIYQAAQSTKVGLPVDASITGCTVPVLSCATASVSVPTSVVLTNTGVNPLTAATIYYKVDNGSYSTATWTGSIAAGGNATVTIPSVSLSVGNHTITDSVVSVNGAADVNTANNAAVTKITVRDASAATLPVTTGFENGGSVPANWTLYDEDGNGSNWVLRANAGAGSSIYSLMYFNYGYVPGEVNSAILPGNMPSAGTHALDFQLAYAQYSNEDDKLDIVYSSDCGVTWSTIWSDHGSSMATHAPVGNNTQFVPVEGDWRSKSIDVSSVPAGAMIAFRATSDYGNNLYIDNVNLRDGAAVGVKTVASAQEVKLYPNPAQEATTLQFTLAKAGSVQVSVLDATGRTMSVIANENMKAGAQRFNISTSSFAAGMYQVVIRSEEGTTTQRLSVVK